MRALLVAMLTACSASDFTVAAPRDGAPPDTTMVVDSVAADGEMPIGGDTTSPDPAVACAAQSRSICDKQYECAPFHSQTIFRDKLECVEMQTRACVANYNAEGNTRSIAKIAACAPELAKMTCGDFVSLKFPPPCTPGAGTLPPGAKCRTHDQCKSGFCSQPAGDVCGECAGEPSGPGKPCVNGTCGYNLTCVAGTCREWGTLGMTCSAGQPCALDLYCDLTSGKCVPRPTDAQKCDSARPCNYLKGFYCSGTGTCAGYGLPARVSRAACSPRPPCCVDRPASAAPGCASRPRSSANPARARRVRIAVRATCARAASAPRR